MVDEFCMVPSSPYKLFRYNMISKSSSEIIVSFRSYTPCLIKKVHWGEFMTEEQRDDLITELTIYSPTQIRKFLNDKIAIFLFTSS